MDPYVINVLWVIMTVPLLAHQLQQTYDYKAASGYMRPKSSKR